MRAIAVAISSPVLRPRARARARNCAKRDYKRNGGTGESEDSRKIRCETIIPAYSSLSFSARGARGRTIDTLIYRACTTRGDPESYTKRRIYRRGGIIIFASPANDSSGNREPRSDTWDLECSNLSISFLLTFIYALDELTRLWNVKFEYD